MGADADVVRRLTNEVFVGGNLDVFEELVDDDVVDHDPVPGTTADKKGMRQLIEMVLGGFSDRNATVDEYMDTTDGRVVESWVFTAKHTGEFVGLPGSGQSVQVRGVEIWRVDNGKIVERWGAVDMSDVFEKAGA